jgi:hypothetical protein
MHGYCTLSTDDDVRVLHELTGWSIANNVPLDGLVSTRPSLEDIYLSLVGHDLLTDQAAPEPTGAHR